MMLYYYDLLLQNKNIWKLSSHSIIKIIKYTNQTLVLQAGGAHKRKETTNAMVISVPRK